MSTTAASLTTPISKKQRAGSNRLFQLDNGALLVPPWQASMSISASQVIQPTWENRTGFWYQAAGPGQTGDNEPGWGSVLAGPTTDGSLTWTAIDPPGSGQDSIATVTYTQVSPPDALLTITPGTNSQRVAGVMFGGGTSGNVYTINAAITMVSGQTYVAQILLTIL